MLVSCGLTFASVEVGGDAADDLSADSATDVAAAGAAVEAVDLQTSTLRIARARASTLSSRSGIADFGEAHPP